MIKSPALFLFLCLAGVGIHAGQAPIGGFAMPTLADERATYRAFGKTWLPTAEPIYPTSLGFAVSNPNVHGDTEGDDLWSYLMMYLRTNQKGYLERAQAWADYQMNGYVKCQGGEDNTLCYDQNAFLLCHMYGWGLIAWYEYSGDAKALEAAEALGDRLDTFLSTSSASAYPVPGKKAINYYGPRGPARHLHLFTRLAEVTGKKRWIDLRNLMIEVFMKSPDWDDRGMYFVGDWQTDSKQGEGAYASGIRMMSSFQLGVLTEAFAQAYRTTQDSRIKEKMIAMARFVDKHGLDPTYDYTGGHLGLKNGVTFHDYTAKGATDFWDPAYTTSVVNTLVWGFKLTGDSSLLKRAFYFFDRGNKGIYGEPIKRNLGNADIHHFVDSRFSTAMENRYLDYNKGELQYSWALFDQNKPGAAIHNPTIRFSGVKASVHPGHVDFSGPGLGGLGRAFITDLQGNAVSILTRPSPQSREGGPALRWDTERTPFGLYYISIQSKDGMHSEPILIRK